jgi:hypothetical protein
LLQTNDERSKAQNRGGHQIALLKTAANCFKRTTNAQKLKVGVVIKITNDDSIESVLQASVSANFQ